MRNCQLYSKLSVRSYIGIDRAAYLSEHLSNFPALIHLTALLSFWDILSARL